MKVHASKARSHPGYDEWSDHGANVSNSNMQMWLTFEFNKVVVGYLRVGNAGKNNDRCSEWICSGGQTHCLGRPGDGLREIVRSNYVNGRLAPVIESSSKFLGGYLRMQNPLMGEVRSHTI